MGRLDGIGGGILWIGIRRDYYCVWKMILCGGLMTIIKKELSPILIA